MIRALFAYGTLQHGHAPAEMAAAVAQLNPIGQGTVPGALYNFGDYPGAILLLSSKERVHGTVFELPHASDFLRELDAYEEYDPEDPAGSQFLRTSCVVELDSGAKTECWIYIYNRALAGACKIDGGRWVP